jgi:hypothetical protein
VNGFIDNAVQILEAAENVMMAGETPSEFSILLGVNGGIRMVADSDWPLDSLQREYGARMAYRVTPRADRVSVDGVDQTRTCHFETASSAQTARLLLNSFPNWHAAVPAPPYAYEASLV